MFYFPLLRCSDQDLLTKEAGWGAKTFQAFRAGADASRISGQAARSAGGLRALAGATKPSQIAMREGMKGTFRSNMAELAKLQAQHGNSLAYRMGSRVNRFVQPFATSRGAQYWQGRGGPWVSRFNAYGKPLAIGVPSYYLGKGRGYADGASEAVHQFEEMPFYQHLLYGMSGPLGLRPMLTDWGLGRARDKWKKEHPFQNMMGGGLTWNRVLNNVQDLRS